MYVPWIQTCIHIYDMHKQYCVYMHLNNVIAVYVHVPVIRNPSKVSLLMHIFCLSSGVKLPSLLALASHSSK